MKWEEYHFFFKGKCVLKALALEDTKDLVVEFLANKFAGGDKSLVGAAKYQSPRRQVPSLDRMFSSN